MELSVIIPVYNTEQYLPRCVDAVLANQGIGMEVILVDDGSRDASPIICDDYACRYPCVKVLHVPNGGPATAKNRGLELATGDYVAMIDSDDEVKADMFVKLMRLARECDADVVCCNYEERYDDGTLRQFEYTHLPYTYSRQEALHEFLAKGRIYTQCWAKIYRRSLLEEHGITNIPGLMTDEDFIFNMYALAHARRVCVCDEPLYVYSMRSQSLSKDYYRNHLDTYIDNRLLHFHVMEELVSRYSPENKVDALFNRMYYSNELLGRIAHVPEAFGSTKTKSVLRTRRLHLPYILKHHRRFGFSSLGTLLLLLPSSFYLRYRQHNL